MATSPASSPTNANVDVTQQAAAPTVCVAVATALCILKKSSLSSFCLFAVTEGCALRSVTESRSGLLRERQLERSVMQAKNHAHQVHHARENRENGKGAASIFATES